MRHMMRAATLGLLMLVLPFSAHAAKPSSSCAVTTGAAADPGYIALHILGSVPNKTVPYLRIDGAQEWTALHNQKGSIDDWTSRTRTELPGATTHTAEIIDAPNGAIGSSVVATCTFQT